MSKSSSLKESIYKLTEEKITVKNHISEEKDKVLKFIDKNRRVLLTASPGSGKTYFFTKLCEDIIRNKRDGRIIFCSPFLVIQSQFRHNIEKLGLKIDIELNSEISKKKHLLKDNYKIITSTYKSLHKIDNEISEKDLIVVDEAHTLYHTFGKGKNREFYFSIFKILFKTQAKIVLMTGTPYEGLSEVLRLDTLKVINSTKESTINIQYSNEKNTALALDFAKSCLNEYGEDYLNIIYIKNKAECERIKHIIKLNLGVDCFVLTADNKESQVYKDLAKASLLPKNYSFLITTNVISTGANILNENIGNALMIGEFNPVEIKQFSKRFRKKMDISVDVVNRYYSKFKGNSKREQYYLKRNQAIQQHFYLSQIDNITKYTASKEALEIDYSYYPNKSGSPENLINQIIDRILIQEASFVEKYSETYNTPDELAKILDNYEDVIPVKTQYYNFGYSHEDIGERLINILKEEKFNNLMNDFISNSDDYLNAAYYYLKSSPRIIEKQTLVNYLSPIRELRTLPIDSLTPDRRKLFSETNFIDKILIPSIKLTKYTKDLLYSIEILRTYRKNKLGPIKIALATNEFLRDFLIITYNGYPEMAPQLRLKPNLNDELLDEGKLYTFNLIIKVFDYFMNKELINIDDLKSFLLRHFSKKVPEAEGGAEIFLKSIKINSDKTPTEFKTPLLKAIIEGLFYFQPKQTTRNIKGTGAKKYCYLFYDKLPEVENSTSISEQSVIRSIRNNSTIINFQKHTIGHGELIEDNSIRIISNRELILYSKVQSDFYELIDKI